MLKKPRNSLGRRTANFEPEAAAEAVASIGLAGLALGMENIFKGFFCITFCAHFSYSGPRKFQLQQKAHAPLLTCSALPGNGEGEGVHHSHMGKGEGVFKEGIPPL